MSETSEHRKARNRQADLARLRALRPIDDDFLRCLFRDNIPLAEFVLRIITGKSDLVISSIRSLMKTMKLTAEQAMDALSIPAEEQEKLHALI